MQQSLGTRCPCEPEAIQDRVRDATGVSCDDLDSCQTTLAVRVLADLVVGHVAGRRRMVQLEPDERCVRRCSGHLDRDRELPIDHIRVREDAQGRGCSLGALWRKRRLLLPGHFLFREVDLARACGRCALVRIRVCEQLRRMAAGIEVRHFVIRPNGNVSAAFRFRKRDGVHVGLAVFVGIAHEAHLDRGHGGSTGKPQLNAEERHAGTFGQWFGHKARIGLHGGHGIHRTAAAGAA